MAMLHLSSSVENAFDRLSDVLRSNTEILKDNNRILKEMAGMMRLNNKLIKSFLRNGGNGQGR